MEVLVPRRPDRHENLRGSRANAWQRPAVSCYQRVTIAAPRRELRHLHSGVPRRSEAFGTSPQGVRRNQHKFYMPLVFV